MSTYPFEVAQICQLSPEITAKYDLSTVQTWKTFATHALPAVKQLLANLMPNLTQITNVIFKINFFQKRVIFIN